MLVRPHFGSLTGRLLTLLVLSLTAVAVLLGIGGWWLIGRVAEEAGDRVLGASTRAIAEALAVEDGEVTLDLPPSALGMLENSEHDNVYYSIVQGSELLSGYEDLPRPDPRHLEVERTQFRYVVYRGKLVRVATEARRLPRIEDLVVVQVAETLEARRAIAARLLVGLVVLDFLFIAIAALLVWPAVTWSLRSVMRLRSEIEGRDSIAGDFTRLNEAGVPAELRGLVHAFNTLLGSLEHSVERIMNFTADASHQMRTPLAVLRTHIALVKRRGTGTAEGRASLGDIENAATRLQRLLVQLIALARADQASTSAIDLTAVDLRELINSVVAGLRVDAQRAGVHMLIEDHALPHPVLTEPVLASELLFNLLDNAIRYNRREGSVKVRICDDAVHSTIEVEDDGPGIPREDRERIFQRFYRLSRDQNRHGTGLGLSIVRALAQSLRADVMLADGAGGTGLKVTVRFAAIEVRRDD